MKKIFSLIVLVFMFIALVQAQTATQVIDNLLETVKKEAIKTDFALEIKDKSSQNLQTLTGTFTMKADKFIMNMNEMEVYFNGKTQWAYSPRSNEVTISEPTDTELAETNPIAILYSFRATSDVRFSSQKTSNNNYYIELIPKDKKSEISKIVVEINKSTRNLVSVTQSARDGNSMSLKLSNFEKKVSISDASFTFNTSKYKNIFVNDLR